MPDEINAQALAADLGREMFGSGASGDTPDPEAASPAEDLSTTPAESKSPPSPADESQSASPAPLPPLPKAWKKEKEALWTALSPEAREYIIAREDDVAKGFSQYSGSHKNWTELTAPFQQVMAQYPDVNPVQVMQTLMRNHLTMLGAPAEQKVELAKLLLKSYGVEIPSGAPASGEEEPPAVAALKGEIASLRENLRQLGAGQYQRDYQEQMKVVTAFAQDPKNKHFEKVAPDVVRFLQTGAASSLAEAYQLACYANPEVRAQLIAEEATPPSAPTPPVKAPVNISGNGEGTPTRRKPVSIDATIAEVVRKHYSH